MNAARKIVEHKSQKYASYWQPLLMSERAESKCRDLSILYAAFPRVFAKTMASLLEEVRLRGAHTDKINVVEVIAEEDVPSGIKISFTACEEGILLCDVWTPPQPQLFGVQNR
jgi:hypothetical protein